MGRRYFGASNVGEAYYLVIGIGYFFYLSITIIKEISNTPLVLRFLTGNPWTHWT